MKVTVPLSEVRELFELLEKLNALFHQEARYADPAYVRGFADAHYEQIRRLYYDTVWEWLPPDVQDEIAGD